MSSNGEVNNSELESGTLNGSGSGGEEATLAAGSSPQALSQQQVQRIVKEVLDTVIGTNAYSYADSTAWNTAVVEQITTELVKTPRPYKYIVTSSLLQTSNGSGMNVSSVSYWNKATDLSFSIRWENKHMLAVVNVFAVSF